MEGGGERWRALLGTKANPHLGGEGEGREVGGGGVEGEVGKEGVGGGSSVVEMKGS